ncbi:hypothetical protein Gogos_000687, partial [Gossypium gossypioides]|nr:hypothetical protein [Gossypium gossypioides]
SITIDRKLLVGSGFFTHGQYRLGVRVGPETDQRIHRKVKTQDANIPSSIQGVYHHFGGRAITIEIIGGWVYTHRVCSIC